MIELDRTKHKWIIHTDRIDSIVVFSLYQIQNIIIHFPSFFHHDYLTRIWQCGQLARKIFIHFRLILLLGLCHTCISYKSSINAILKSNIMAPMEIIFVFVCFSFVFLAYFIVFCFVFVFDFEIANVLLLLLLVGPFFN